MGVEFASSHITGAPPKVNANTRLAGMVAWPSIATSDLRDAYRYVEAAHRAMPKTLAPGYRLFWVKDATLGSIDVPAADGAFTIVGRHSQCDAFLNRDPEIALRHLLVRAIPGAGGGLPLLHVQDLRTSLAFHLEGDTAVRSMLARGAVAVRLGRYALVALPSGIDAARELPSPVIEHASGSPYRSPAPRSLTDSHVTILPQSTSIEELAAASHGFARMTLQRGGRSLAVDVTERDLDKGIFIGRALRCDQRLASLLDVSISRVHLLVLRDKGAVVAFDLASMNGTYTMGQRARRVALASRGTTLYLGSHGLALHWQDRRA